MCGLLRLLLFVVCLWSCVSCRCVLLLCVGCIAVVGCVLFVVCCLMLRLCVVVVVCCGLLLVVVVCCCWCLLWFVGVCGGLLCEVCLLYAADCCLLFVGYCCLSRFVVCCRLLGFAVSGRRCLLFFFKKIKQMLFGAVRVVVTFLFGVVVCCL